MKNTVVLYMKYYKERSRFTIKKEISTKDWLPFEMILEKGIIKNNKKYIKLIRVIPINYDLKSNLEKESILSAYKLFLKTCDFDIQIIVQSKKEDLSKHISNIQKIMSNEKNSLVKKISENYLNFIQEKNIENKSSSKNFFIVLENEIPEYKNEENDSNFEKVAVNNLSEMYFKVKESLSRCGNVVQDVNSKKEIIEILNSFYNPRMLDK